MKSVDGKGKRIRLVQTTDPYTRLRPGSEGTVQFVDDTGTLHIKWDSGEYLGLVPGEDQYEVIS